MERRTHNRRSCGIAQDDCTLFDLHLHGEHAQPEIERQVRLCVRQGGRRQRRELVLGVCTRQRLDNVCVGSGSVVDENLEAIHIESKTGRQAFVSLRRHAAAFVRRVFLSKEISRESRKAHQPVAPCEMHADDGDGIILGDDNDIAGSNTSAKRRHTERPNGYSDLVLAPHPKS
ncbi:hypothetical protein CLUG_03407 [Clavispora lusitaniae ATCC 42720]|uniref:Uncharacterized protein n=1 Tax=Clavispora lusitaniae (strain ATCC 42720) TaxID=306902 RepID=C4Y5H3_CLAL4|nr:uncharacterized protein CLUG_03407 [Clavispora lusitaniae ATCC 42720]EEQ39280.1 hypothetical protein CLUG_03407 [Clavispora lusitaniae ATCC 42720]